MDSEGCERISSMQMVNVWGVGLVLKGVDHCQTCLFHVFFSCGYPPTLFYMEPFDVEEMVPARKLVQARTDAPNVEGAFPCLFMCVRSFSSLFFCFVHCSFLYFSSPLGMLLCMSFRGSPLGQACVLSSHWETSLAIAQRLDSSDLVTSNLQLASWRTGTAQGHF